MFRCILGKLCNNSVVIRCCAAFPINPQKTETTLFTRWEIYNNAVVSKPYNNPVVASCCAAFTINPQKIQTTLFPRWEIYNNPVVSKTVQQPCSQAENFTKKKKSCMQNTKWPYSQTEIYNIPVVIHNCWFSEYSPKNNSIRKQETWQQHPPFQNHTKTALTSWEYHNSPVVLWEKYSTTLCIFRHFETTTLLRQMQAENLKYN